MSKGVVDKLDIVLVLLNDGPGEVLGVLVAHGSSGGKIDSLSVSQLSRSCMIG